MPWTNVVGIILIVALALLGSMFAEQRASPLRRPLILSLLFFAASTASLLVTPPFQTPDAGSHYFRAWQISEGQVFGEKRGIESGGVLPVVISEDWFRFADLPFRAGRKISLSDWKLRLSRSPPLTQEQTNRRVFTNFPNTVLYAPVPYLPQAFGIALARLLHLRDLEAVYLAGFFSVLACTALLFCALRVLELSWRMANLCFLAAAMPMSVALAGSTSADGVIVALATLTLALALRLRRAHDARTFAGLLVTAVLLSFCKGLYFLVPIAAISIALPSFPREWRSTWRRALLLFAASLLPMLLWNLSVRHLYNTNPPTPFRQPDPRVNPALQWQFVLHHLWPTLRMFALYFADQSRDLCREMVGVLGWLEVWLPDALYRAWWIGLIAVALVGSREERAEERYGVLTTAWVLATCLAFIFALCLFVYLSWTVVGAGLINGLQGRYFIPWAAMFLSALPRILNLGKRTRMAVSTLILGGWGISMWVMFSALVSRYWRTG